MDGPCHYSVFVNDFGPPMEVQAGPHIWLLCGESIESGPREGFLTSHWRCQRCDLTWDERVPLTAEVVGEFNARYAAHGA